MNWLSHLELIEDAARLHPAGVLAVVSMPDSLADAFCIAE